MKIKFFMMFLALQSTAQSTIKGTPFTLLESARQRKDPALKTIENHIEKIKDLGVDLNTPVQEYLSNAKTPAEHLVSLFFSSKYSSDYSWKDTRKKAADKAAKLKDLGVDLNTPLKQKEEGSTEEKLVYRLYSNLSIDALEKELKSKKALVAQEEGEKAPSKKVKTDDFNPDHFFVSERMYEKNIFKNPDGSVTLEQKERVTLFPKNQEKKEKWSEIKEEDKAPGKRSYEDRHLD